MPDLPPCPPGLTVLAHGSVDYSPGAGLRDCLRKIRDAAPSVPPGDVAVYTEEYLSAYVAAVAAGMLDYVRSRPESAGGGKTNLVAHTHAADAVRVHMIRLLQLHHRPPHERVPYAGPPVPGDDAEPVRSRIFREMEVYRIEGIDSVARVVGGTDPPVDRVQSPEG